MAFEDCIIILSEILKAQTTKVHLLQSVKKSENKRKENISMKIFQSMQLLKIK